MKALILAAGKGTRLRPVTDKVIKPLLPLRGQPTLHYVISELLVLGITEIGIVVSPDNQAQINNFIEENRSLDENFIEIIVQEEQLGVAHAVASARSFIGNQNFVLYLGDNLFESGVDQVLTEFNRNQITTIGLKQVKDPSKFGVGVVGMNGELTKIIEKPKNSPSKFAVTGIYCFTPDIMKSIETLKLSPRGEFEITGAVQDLIDNNIKVQTKIIDGWWVDTGNLQDFLIANKKISNSLHVYKLNIPDENLNCVNSRIDGSVLIKPSVKIMNSIISNFSSIEDNVVIENSTIENCVVMKNCVIRNTKLINCLVGPSVVMEEKKCIENEIL